MKIKKRDIAFFFLGILSFYLAESIYDWEGTKQAMRDGANASSTTFEKVESKTE